MIQTKSPNNLFDNLTPDELELSAVLRQKIVTAIDANRGAIRFSEYMQMALYDPDYGYYNNLLHKFGTQGDFITSPTLSILFGQTLAKQISELFAHIPQTNILEIGAGDGSLMRTLLSALEDQVAHYYILEVSANLINHQKQQLQEQYPHLLAKVTWLTAIPSGFVGVVIANEVLDAQPCELIHWKDDKIYVRMVGIKNNELVYLDTVLDSGLRRNDDTLDSGLRRNDDTTLAEIVHKLPIHTQPYTSEINLNNRGFIASLADHIDTGAVLFIDYGYGEAEYYASKKNHGTLRGFFRHHLLDDVLVYPGLIDITTSVDFSAIATTAIAQNLDFIGYTTQANFLLNCGIVDILAQSNHPVDSIEYISLSQQLNQLTSPNHLGDAFKVMGLAKNMHHSNWRGFQSGDKSYLL